jgi:hypothetical protein
MEEKKKDSKITRVKEKPRERAKKMQNSVLCRV